MPTGSELIETWIPDGGFKLDRRRVRTPQGETTVTECLVPKWEHGELTPDQPCARQPCLHRIVADCQPEKDAILALAGGYGLLAASIAIRPEEGKPVPASTLTPEPLDLWRREIRELKAVGGYGTGSPPGTGAATRCWNGSLPPVSPSCRFFDRRSRERIGLPDALPARHSPHPLWQRMAGEVAGLLHCSHCPAPRCGRWFLKGDASRSDKRFCSGPCRNRIFRRKEKASL
jgi:hypothetical protein